MLKLAAGAGLLALVAAAQPTINRGGVVNDASYAQSGLPNANIAQGSIMAIFGRNLGPAAGVSVPGFPLPTTDGLGGTKVEIAVVLQRYNAPVLYARSDVVLAILPSAVPVAAAAVLVTYQDQTSEPEPIQVVQRSFGALARNSQGSGPGVIHNVTPAGAFTDNTVFQPARPGQLAVLWGTGLGPVTFDETQMPEVGNLAAGAEVWVGGKPATVAYQGRTQCCAGVDQINFFVPQDAPQGCYVPVMLRAGGVTSNITTMSIAASGSTCSDANGIAAADLATATVNRMLSVGTLFLNRLALAPGDAGGRLAAGDTGAARFMRYSYDQLWQSRGLTGFPSLGGCTVYTFTGANWQTVDKVQPVVLTAGPSVFVTRAADNLQRQIDSAGANGIYTGALTSSGLTNFLSPGSYRITGAPGPNDSVRLTPVNFDVSSGVTWLQPPTSVPRNQDLTVQWTGGDPAREFVQIAGFSIGAVPAINVAAPGAIFLCSAPAGAHQFTVPAAVLSLLPASDPAGANGALMVGATSLGTRYPGSGSIGLDSLYLFYNLLAGATVRYP